MGSSKYWRPQARCHRCLMGKWALGCWRFSSGICIEDKGLWVRFWGQQPPPGRPAQLSSGAARAPAESGSRAAAARRGAAGLSNPRAAGLRVAGSAAPRADGRACDLRKARRRGPGPPNAAHTTEKNTAQFFLHTIIVMASFFFETNCP